MLLRLIVLLALLFSCPLSYSSASTTKKQLLSIYLNYPYTFLCEEPFDNKGVINIKVCPGCPTQATKIQWMQIVPLKILLQEQTCFKERICFDGKGNRFGGIRCCKKMHAFVKNIEGDLHNLVPELLQLKKIRDTHQFANIIDPSVSRSTCDIKIDSKNKIIQPSEKRRGMIARVYLYMSIKYRVQLDKNQQKLYETWHRQFPPSEWERKRNDLIEKVQGDRNPYIY